MGGIIMYYLLDKYKKEVIEMKELEDIRIVLESMKLKYYNYFPYEDAGYEDPYNFLEDYKLITLSGKTIEVEE